MIGIIFTLGRLQNKTMKTSSPHPHFKPCVIFLAFYPKINVHSKLTRVKEKQLTFYCFSSCNIYSSKNQYRKFFEILRGWSVAYVHFNYKYNSLKFFFSVLS